MATSVQIELMVDEKGAVSGVRAFDSAVKGSTGSVRQLGTELAAVGTRAAAAGQKGKQALDQVGAAALSSHEKVRLVSEEFGIRIPRAMQAVISKSPQVTAALNAIGGAMIALGAIQIGAMVGTALYEGAKKLYEKWLDVDGAIKRYNDEAGEAASKRFYEDAGLDQLNADLIKANQELDRLNQKKINSPKADMGPSGSQFATPGIYKIAHLFGAKTPEHFGVSDANAQNTAQGGLDTTRLKLIEDTHRKNLQQIEDNKLISEAKVTGIAKARVAQDAENKKADEDQQFAIKRAQALAEIANRGINNKGLKPGDKGYREAVVVSPDTGNAENADAKAHAAAELQARQFETDREHALELMHLREQALEAGLRGIALYKAQEAAAIAELKSKDMDSTAARNAIHAKFHAEEMRRLEDEGRETEKIERQASLAGLTGIAKTRAEGANRVADINADPNLDDANRARRVAAIGRETDAEVLESKRTMAVEINAISDESAAHQISGFARINAEAVKQIDAWREKIQKEYGVAPKIGPLTTDQAEGKRLLEQVTATVDKGADSQRGELAKKNAQETEQLEAQARAKFLSAEKQKTAAIQTELQERKQKYLEELNAQEISQDDYNRRVAAAQETANAEMVEAATEARKKMAGEFTSFFEGMEHPGKYFAKLGDKAAGEASASLFQHFMGAKSGAGTDSKGGAGGRFGDIISGFGFGKKDKIPGAGADAKAEMRGGHGAAEKAFSISSATIHIGSASISGGGAGGVGPGGSTTLLAPGATGATGGFGTGGSSASTGASSASGKGSITGGAGMSSAAAVASSLSAPGGGVGPTKRDQARGAIGDVSQGVSLTKQLANDFSGGGSQGGKGSSDDKSGADKNGKSGDNGSMTSDGFTQGNVTGAAQGAMGVWGAHESGGGISGGLKGAASGAELGMAIAGPMGAAVGAAAGAVIGAIGTSHAAVEYDKKTVKPRIASDLAAFHSGGMNYMDAFSDGQSLEMEAEKTTKKMGAADTRYYNNTIKPEILQFMGKLTAEQKAGRSQYTSSVAQYAFGTDSVPGTGYALLHDKERVMPSDQNERITRAVESGASLSAVHASYQRAMQSSDARRGSGGGDRTMNMNIHAIDAKGVSQFLDKYKHQIRSAVNDSYAENSGGGMN